MPRWHSSSRSVGAAPRVGGAGVKSPPELGEPCGFASLPAAPRLTPIIVPCLIAPCLIAEFGWATSEKKWPSLARLEPNECF